MDGFMNLIGVKRVVIVGGWDFSTDPSTYDIFRQAVSTAENRATLVSNTLAFLGEWHLDGIDWDWEYPGEPDIPGIPANSTTSAENLFQFLNELSEQMPSGKTISTTTPSSFWYLKAYPIQAISSVVDYIVMMTYDLHGQWDYDNKNADPGCPTGSCLRSHVNLTETISALSMITKAGVPSNKVAVGVASYGRSFQMAEAGCYGPDCFFTGPQSGADPGPCTNTAGYISDYELYVIANDTSIYSYIDVDSNSIIMVWDETQWAGFMDASIKDSRRSLYDGVNFLGTADWAIDLQAGNDTFDNSTSDSSTQCEMYIDPTVWSEDSPTITAEPGCELIWPPMPLSTPTTIEFPPWPTHVTYRSTGPGTMTMGNSSFTYYSFASYSSPTTIIIPPLTTDAIPVWYQRPSSGQVNFVQTPSILQAPFPIVITPTIGGNTTVIGGTTSTVSSVNYTSGTYTYYSPEWVGVFGGTTSVINGTTLAPTTTTVTPHPYPTTTGSSSDSVLNTKKTSYSSTSSGGGPKTSADPADEPWKCDLYCLLGCPLCPPGAGPGGSNPNGNNNDNTRTDDSSTSTSSESAYLTVAAMGTIAYVDPLPTTDAVADLEAFASSEAALMQSLYGSEISYVLTATGMPSATATTTPAPTSMAYTYTESGGAIVACGTAVIEDYATADVTTCLAGITTIGTAYAYTYSTVDPSASDIGWVIGCVSDLVIDEGGAPETTLCLGSTAVISTYSISWISTTVHPTTTVVVSPPTPCVYIYGTLQDGFDTEYDIEIDEAPEQPGEANTEVCTFTCEENGDDCTAKCNSGYSAKAYNGDDWKSAPLNITYNAPYGSFDFAVDITSWEYSECCPSPNAPCQCYTMFYNDYFLNCPRSTGGLFGGLETPVTTTSVGPQATTSVGSQVTTTVGPQATTTTS